MAQESVRGDVGPSFPLVAMWLFSSYGVEMVADVDQCQDHLQMFDLLDVIRSMTWIDD